MTLKTIERKIDWLAQELKRQSIRESLREERSWRHFLTLTDKISEAWQGKHDAAAAIREQRIKN